MSAQGLSSLLASRHFTVSSHFLADVDGVCSAFLLSSLFPDKCIVSFYDEPSSLARRVCRLYNLNYSVAPSPPESTVLVDVSDPALLPERGRYMALVDHHAKPAVDAGVVLSDPASPSTTHVIFKSLMGGDPSALTPVQAELILLGILSDTHRFKSSGSPSLFSDVSALLSSARRTYDELLAVLEHELTHSERIVFMRSFRSYRMLRERSGMLFVITDCESFQSLVAEKLVECLGADVGIAYSKYDREGEVRISARSSNTFNADLGTIMSRVGRMLGGSGGGHRHAAGANIPLERAVEVEKTVISVLGERFSLKEENAQLTI